MATDNPRVDRIRHMPSCSFCQLDSDRVVVASEVALAFLDAYLVNEENTLAPFARVRVHDG
jgi:hypothetical protein